MQEMVRVRIAPSPTGIPHIGNTRTALFNYLFARKTHGKFILRIEDTDQARMVPKSEKAIEEILQWLGLNWDEKYVQSERLKIYHEHAKILEEKGFLYKDGDALRFKMLKDGLTAWTDAVDSKQISFENKTQEDFVAIKSDGFPTYNFANVVDDHLMEITHVIRGDEFISSTTKHIQLYKAFGWEAPVFAHLPVILGPDRQKLSKRHGAKSVLEYRDEGYLKEALLNFMAILGWNPGGDKEIMSLNKIIKLFDLKDVNTASPIFDLEKLKWMNGVYIRQTQNSKLKTQILNFLRDKNILVDKNLLDQLIPLTQTRMSTLSDFYSLTQFIFEEITDPFSIEEKEIAKELISKFSSIKEWNSQTILTMIKALISDKKIKMPLVYKILTGKNQGLPLPQELEILGKEKTIEKLKKRLR